METYEGEQILNAAKKLFTNYGFKKVSMDEIASEAGVTKKTVYTYFPSKKSFKILHKKRKKSYKI